MLVALVTWRHPVIVRPAVRGVVLRIMAGRNRLAIRLARRCILRAVMPIGPAAALLIAFVTRWHLVSVGLAVRGVVFGIMARRDFLAIRLLAMVTFAALLFAIVTCWNLA